MNTEPDKSILEDISIDNKRLDAIKRWFVRKKNFASLDRYQRIVLRPMLKDISSGKLGIFFCAERKRLSELMNDNRGGEGDTGHVPNFFEHVTDAKMHIRYPKMQLFICLAVPESTEARSGVWAHTLVTLYSMNVMPPRLDENNAIDYSNITPIGVLRRQKREHEPRYEPIRIVQKSVLGKKHKAPQYD